MWLDSDHSPPYTFYNGLGWEPRQKVDCISSGYFYPVFAIISTRDIPISVSGDESINIISLGLTILDYGRGHNIYPGCNVLVLTECSCSLFPGQCRWHGPGSWQGVMTVSRKCEDVMLSRIINRHLWCLLVSQHCILSSWHLPTSTLKWGDKIQDPFLPKYLYQSVCPPDSCYC